MSAFHAQLPVRFRPIADVRASRQASASTPEPATKLPIRNRTGQPLTLFIEPYCDQYDIPDEGEAIVTLADGAPHSLDFNSAEMVSIWDEGDSFAKVEIVTKEQNAVIEALAFGRRWLHCFGGRGEEAATDLDAAVECEEETSGYFGARCEAYKAFRHGFRAKEAQAEDAPLPEWAGSKTLAAAYRAGVTAAHFNQRTRHDPRLIDLGEAPFDTDVARQTFGQADAFVR
jgi:hypothetical protein